VKGEGGPHQKSLCSSRDTWGFFLFCFVCFFGSVGVLDGFRHDEVLFVGYLSRMCFFFPHLTAGRSVDVEMILQLTPHCAGS